MSLRHNLILLLTSAFGLLALIGPSFAPAKAPSLRPVVSAAPPLDAGIAVGAAGDPASADDSTLVVLRGQADGALRHLQAQAGPANGR